MSCEGCPLTGNCPAAKIGEAAFTGEVAAEDITTQQQSGVEDFSLVRLAVSVDPESLVAQRCAEQLEESATPMTALLEAGPSVTGSYAESEAAIPDLEHAQATLKSEGGISAHKNRYSGRDPAECPMIGSMGQAGLEMVEKLEAAEKDPSRGKTIAELLAERNQQQPSTKPEKPAVVKPQALTKQKASPVVQPEIAALHLVKPLSEIGADQLKLPQETIMRPVIEATSLDLTDRITDSHAARRQISAAEITHPLAIDPQLEDHPTEAIVVAAQPATAITPDIIEPAVRVAEPPSLPELRPALDRIILSEEIEVAEGSRVDTSESFVPVYEITPDDEQPALVIQPEIIPILADDEAPLAIEDSVPFYELADDRADTLVLSRIEEEVYEESPVIDIVAEISVQELGAEQTRLETFEAAITEWLTNVVPDPDVAEAVSETDEAPRAQQQTAQPAIEQFEPEIQAKITDVLEAMTQLCEDIGSEWPVEAKGNQLLAVEAIARQFEPLCEQLLEVMELAPNEAAIKAVAEEIAAFVAATPQSSLDHLSTEELNILGTREYKLKLSSILQTHLVRPMRQKIKRLIALSRHILAYISHQQPQVAGALA